MTIILIVLGYMVIGTLGARVIFIRSFGDNNRYFDSDEGKFHRPLGLLAVNESATVHFVSDAG